MNIIRRIVATVVATMPAISNAQPVLSNNPAIPVNLQIRTFATGLSFPYGMHELPDGSLLVATSDGLSSQILRYTQTGGVANAPTTVFTGSSGLATGLAGVGNIVAMATGTGDASKITILRAGAGGALTALSTLSFDYPPSFWAHDSHTIALRAIPGQPNTFQLVFNVGSELNDGPSTGTIGVSGTITQALNPNSIYSLTFGVNGNAVTAGGATQLATGVRNGFAFGFTPAGDVYFGDNGSSLPGFTGPKSPDYFGIIPAGTPGVLDFGFPGTYYDPVTGQQIGPPAGITPPFKLFLPNGGIETRGVAGLALAPLGFPPGLNNGVFFGFYGDAAVSSAGGVVYVERSTGQSIQILENSPTFNRPLSLFATGDALYIADFAGNIPADGAIYRIGVTTAPEPSTMALFGVGALVLLSLHRRRSRES